MKNWWIGIVILLAGCSESKTLPGEVISMQEAQLFFLKKVNQDTLLCIVNGNDTLEFQPQKNPNFHVLSTTLFGYFEVLQSIPQIAGLVYPEAIANSQIKSQLESKQTFSLLDNSSAIDPEQFFLHPAQWILYSPFEPAPQKIPVTTTTVPICDYQESNAWARLEWIKAIGFLNGHYKEACAYFDQVILQKKKFALKNPKPILIGSHDGQHFYWSAKNSAVNQLAADAGFEVLGLDQNGNAALDREELMMQLKKKPQVVVMIGKDQLPLIEKIMAEWRSQYSIETWFIPVDETQYFQQSIIHPEWLLQDFIQLEQAKKTGHFIKAFPA